MQFLLGTHSPHWLAQTDVPLFVSVMRLRKYRTLPVAKGVWALDSGGFTQIAKHGRFEMSAEDYAIFARRCVKEIGGMLWASPQDWMCEPAVLRKTGNTIQEHQRLTFENYILLRKIAPDVPFIPVLQGWDIADYLDHAGLYWSRGVPIDKIALVGLGSVCRRQGTALVTTLIDILSQRGIRLHAFGFKIDGLAASAGRLASADSMAWSRAARYDTPLPGCTHKACNNCQKYAFQWRDKVMASIKTGQQSVCQHALPFYQ